MKVTFVQKDLGGILRHRMADLPHDGSRWSTSPAPAVTLYDRGGGELVASSAASTGPSTTLSSGVSSGAFALALTSVVDLERWQQYVIGPNDLGQWEETTLDGLSTGGGKALRPLQYAYEAGTTFKSHDLTFRVSSGVLESVARDCRATWRYTVKGPPPAEAPIEQKVSTTFHVAHYAPRYSLNADEVILRDPYADKVKGSNQRIDLLLRRLWESKVLPDIARMMPPGALVSGEDCDELLLLAWKHHSAVAARQVVLAESFVDMYQSQLGLLERTLTDLDESGGTDDAEVVRGPMTPRLLRG